MLFKGTSGRLRHVRGIATINIGWVSTDVGDAGLQNQPQEHLTLAASFCLCNVLISEEGKTNMGKTFHLD